MKFYLSATIEADTLDEAWTIAISELPTDFTPDGWWSTRVSEFILVAADGKPMITGVK